MQRLKPQWKPANELHHFIHRFAQNARTTIPQKIRNTRQALAYFVGNPPTHPATVWLIQEMLDGAATEVVLSLAEARHLLGLATTQLLDVPFSDTQNTTAVLDIRNKKVGHSRVVRMSKAGRAKVDELSRLYRGQDFYDLLSAALGDLRAAANELRSHPQFAVDEYAELSTHTHAETMDFVPAINVRYWIELSAALSEKNLY